MKPIKILRLNRKHLSQMTYYFTSFQDNSCSHDGQSSICRIHSMQYIPVTPNMRDYNLLDSLGVAPDLERILDYAMLYGATYHVQMDSGQRYLVCYFERWRTDGNLFCYRN